MSTSNIVAALHLLHLYSRVQHGYFPLAQVEKDEALKRAEGLQRQLEELHKDHESLRKTNTLALQEKVCNEHAADVCSV